MNEKSFFKKNLVSAFSAQVLSLVTSFLITLVLPKILNVSEYSYWQLFIFYVGYVGLFHFGFNDGLYLKLGGKRQDELDNSSLKSQFVIFFILQLFVAFIIFIFAYFFVPELNRKFVFYMSSLYLIINNIFLYFGYIFQAINETKIYSYSLMIDRFSACIFILILLLFNVRNFELYIVLYTISKLISLGYIYYKSQFIMKNKLTITKKDFYDGLNNIRIGIKLTIANIASMLILGVGRIIIDYKWGVVVFGKISLALTMTNFFLLFIQQIAMVMFPALRRVEKQKLKKIYMSLRDTLSLILPLVLVLYIPIKIILVKWLPAYNESLNYLGILLPICLFDGKMQMIYNTFYKVMRGEKRLLFINVLSFFISFVLTLIGVFLVNNINFVVLSMLFVIFLRSIIAEIDISNKMDVRLDYILIEECIIVIIFIILCYYINDFLTFIIILVLYILYLLFNHEKMLYFFKLLKVKR